MDDFNFKWEPPQYPQSAQTAATRTRPRKSNRILPVLLATCMGSALIGGGIGGGIAASVTASSQQPATSISAAGLTTTAEAKPVAETVNKSDLASVISNTMPSVVTISATTSDSGGTGSGVVLNDQGYILTNAHVATLAGASLDAKLSVQTSTGETADAELVGYDPTADLAVLKIDPSTPGLKTIAFANSDEVALGDETIAIGSPLGLAGTVTTGIVSALNRPISVASSEVTSSDQSSASQQAGVSISAIQTDAAINPGNSGGALLNAAGELIGINVAIASAGTSQGEAGNIGVGFAIPSSYAQRVAEEIITKGSATHGYLGSGVSDETEADTVFTTGAVLQGVKSEGPAAQAGLKDGDVITKFGDAAIESATQLVAVVKQEAPGSTVTVTYERNGETSTADVTLTSA